MSQTCGGQGVRLVMRHLGPGMMQQLQQACDRCAGKGYSIPANDMCPSCSGKVPVFPGLRLAGQPLWAGCLLLLQQAWKTAAAEAGA